MKYATCRSLSRSLISSGWSALVLAGMFALSVLPGLAQANAVEQVESAVLPGGKTLVRVKLKEPLAAAPNSFTMASPPRLAIDLPGTANTLGRNLIESNQGLLGSVNVVQAGNRTRLVLNLTQPAQHEISRDGRMLNVALLPAEAVPARFADSAAGKSVRSVRDIDFRRGESGEARIITTLSEAQGGINIRQQSGTVTVDFIGTSLPRALQRKLDVSDFGTPVHAVETYTLGDNTRMVIRPRGGWEYSAYQTDQNFIVEVRRVNETEGRTAAGKPRYTGEKLSLNFQNVEVRAVLQVIADFTGLNIVASDTVTGNLTLRLRDVPWDQALDLIMQTRGLDKRMNGNVIWVAPRDELLAKEKLELETRNQVADLEPLVTEYITLNYMRADEAQTMLYGFASGAFLNAANNNAVTCSAQAQGLGGAAVAQASQSGQSENSDQKILTKRGRATYELKTNTLIITDIPRKIQEIRELLARLDVPARQVMIEARVVVATDDWSRDLGARLRFEAVNNIGKKPQLGGPLSLGGDGSGQALPGIAGAGNLALSLLNLANGNLLGLELRALEAENRGKVISNPRVVTSNQKPAVILNGTQVPFITPATANSPATVTFKDAFLCLLVDPQILNNDSVILTVEVQKDAVRDIAAAGGNPAIDTKRIKTQVRVNNGETLVLGGIFDGIESAGVSKVPLLGDLPVLGNLFRTTSRKNEKIELIIFLTPRILDERLTL